MDDNQALFKVLLLDILPSLLDLTTDLAQAISLLVPQVCTMMMIIIKSILMKVIIVSLSRQFISDIVGVVQLWGFLPTLLITF